MKKNVFTTPAAAKAWHIARIPLLLVAILAAGFFGYTVWTKQTTTSSTSSASTLQTATVRKGSLKLFASGTGTLNPRATASFGFKTSGQVNSILVAVGSAVKAGDLLATLDDSTQQDSLREAQLALDYLVSPSAILAAKLDVENAKVEVQTARNALAYLISPQVLYWEEKLADAQAALAAAQAELAKDPANKDLQAKVKTAESDVARAKSGLAWAQKYYWEEYVPTTFAVQVREGRNVYTKIYPPTDADVAAARAAYAQAKQTQKEAEDYLEAISTGVIPADAYGTKITALKQAMDAVATAKNNIAYTKLYAPIDGTITTLSIGVGDQVATASVITISDLNQPYVLDVYLDESDWSNIGVGYPAEVTFDILSDKTFTGKVLSVDPSLVLTNGTSYIHCKVQLDASIGVTLPSGTGASVDIIGGEANNALLIPVEALHQIGEGQYAVFVQENGVLKMRVVTIGLQDLVSVEIKTGLKEGEVVSTGVVETKQ